MAKPIKYEYKERGCCKDCLDFPMIYEYPDGSGKVHCGCCDNISGILKYNFGFNGEGKQEAIDKWCKDHLEE